MLGRKGPGWTSSVSIVKGLYQKTRSGLRLALWVLVYATQPLGELTKANAFSSSQAYVVNPINGVYVGFTSETPPDFTYQPFYSNRRVIQNVESDSENEDRQERRRSKKKKSRQWQREPLRDEDRESFSEPPPASAEQTPPANDERARGSAPPRSVSAGSTAPISQQKMLSLGPLRRLAHDSAYTWNGCDQSAIIRGGEGGRCGNDYLQPAFANHMNGHLLTCAQSAASRAGYAVPTRLFINHFGCYANRSVRGGSSLSNHALARALDVSGMVLIDGNGKETRVTSNVSGYRGSNKIFYDAFRQCWKDSLPRSCRGQKGSIGIPSSALGGNSLHRDHIHLEFPARCG